jgi:hypothetical protein
LELTPGIPATWPREGEKMKRKMAQTVLVETCLEKNTSFPGTLDNPMRPVMYTHPVTGEVLQAHYNDRNLQTDRDYIEAGFEYVNGKGWCVPVTIE